MPLDAYQELLTRVGEMSLFSLEDLGFGSGEERCNLERRADDATPDPLGALLSQERVSLVSDAIARLPEREKLVVTLEEEIAELEAALGPRIERIHYEWTKEPARPMKARRVQAAKRA